MFEPLIPTSLWVSLVALAVVAGLLYMLYKPPEISRARRIVVAFLWYCGVAGPLGLLLNPTWLRTRPADTSRPRLSVLVDTSQSMATKDADGQARLAAALGDLGQGHQSLFTDFDVAAWAFDDGARPVAATTLTGLEALGEVTDIASALDQVLRGFGEKSGALLLLSDGADNASAGPEAALKTASVAHALGIPVFTRTYGTTSSGKDLAVEVSSPRELAFVGQRIAVTAVVQQRGFEGGVARVTLSDGTRPLEVKDVALGGRPTVPVTFEVGRDEAGVYLYELEVGSAPDEITRLNNQTTFRLTVVDEAIGVLALEGKPYWDFTFLLRTLARDPAVAVTGAVRLGEKRLLVRQLAPEAAPASGAAHAPTGAEPSASKGPAPEKVQVVSDVGGFLADPERLRKCQVVILGRDAESFFTEGSLANLKRWVAEAGGTLVCARGKPMPVVGELLDPLMPVRWVDGGEERLRVRLTPFGESLRWFPSAWEGGEGAPVDRMPSLATSDTVRETKPLAVVVGRGEATGNLAETPVITYQPYGSGRILVLEGSGTWRWAFPPPQYEAASDLYRFFWSSLLRWMVTSTDFLPSQTAALKPSRPTFTTREKVVIFVLLKSEEKEFTTAQPPVVEVASGTGARQARPRRGGTPEASEPLRAPASPMRAGSQEGSPVNAGGQGTGPRVTLTTTPSGKDINLFQAVTGPLEAGYYQARLVRQTDGPPAECVFQVRPTLEEQIDLAARPLFLAQLAQASGGADLTEENGLASLRSLYAAYWMRTHPTETSRKPAWDRLWVMTIAVGIWSVAWIVRRRGGLI